jgi:ubiquinone/menaquinone biosynthesis C-methylase UbiE
VKDHVARFGLVSGMTVADLGSGVGDYTLLLAKRVAPTGMVYAIDVHDDALLALRHRAARAGLSGVVRIVQGDLEEHEGSGLKPGSCDSVLLADTLFQTENKEKVLEEAFRILTPGGILFLIERSATGPMPLPRSLAIEPRELEGWASSVGFAEAKAVETDLLHYGFLFLKPHDNV